MDATFVTHVTPRQCGPSTHRTGPHCGPGTRGRLTPVSSHRSTTSAAAGPGDLGGRAVGLRAGGLPPQLAGRRGPAGRGALRHRRHQLATFTVLQLVVYAAMQVPVGVLLDRFGSRAMLLSGLVLMTGPAGLRLRGLLRRRGRGPGGAGRRGRDGLRQRDPAGDGVVPGPPGAAGHPAHRAGRPDGRDRRRRAAGLPARRLGWTRAFAAVSSIGVVLLVAVAMLVKDSPYRRDEVVHVKLRALTRSVRLAVGQPGHPAGHVVALHLPVLRPPCSRCCGASRSSCRARGGPRPPRAPC